MKGSATWCRGVKPPTPWQIQLCRLPCQITFFHSVSVESRGMVTWSTSNCTISNNSRRRLSSDKTHEQATSRRHNYGASRSSSSSSSSSKEYGSRFVDGPPAVLSFIVPYHRRSTTIIWAAAVTSACLPACRAALWAGVVVMQWTIEQNVSWIHRQFH